MSKSIKIVTVNCRGLGDGRKRKDVLNFYKSKNYNIVCLQDTHFTPELEPYIETQWGYKCIFNSFSSNSRGVAVLFNNNFELVLHKEKKDSEGNLLILDLSINGKRFTLINLYGPNSDSPLFFENLGDLLEEFDNDYFILWVNFNIAFNPILDTHNYRNINNPMAKEKLLQLMENFNLVDYYRILYPDNRVFTWHCKNPVKHARLDYFLISENLSNVVENISIKAGYRSDHSAVSLDLKLSKFSRGPGLWKFNNSLLHDKDYIDKVKSCIKKTKVQYANILYQEEMKPDIPDNIVGFMINDSQFLDVLLMEIRATTISYSSIKKKERDKIENELVTEINSIENNLNLDCVQSFHLLEEKKRNLETIRVERMRGHFIRSKAKWREEGEKPTR